MTPLLEIRDLTVRFGRRRRVALENVSFTLEEGQRLGIIGESGSGKSVLALSIMGLLPDNAEISGSIKLRGTELVGLDDDAYSRLRGDVMTMIFQEPMTALDPTMRIGLQVAEVVRLHYAKQEGLGYPTAPDARGRVLDVLSQVGMPDPQRVAESFPHQLSGGQRQRVLIAMALINRPSLVIADEATTALDVTVQSTVLDLLDRELSAVGAATLFISHDLAVVSQVCSDVLVLYRGDLVESGTIADVLGAPRHPYTQGLVATARIDLAEPGRRLPTLESFLRESAHE